MKNVKLTTVTLALLAGAIVASPAVNAEDSKTVVAPGEETVMAAAGTPSLTTEASTSVSKEVETKGEETVESVAAQKASIASEKAVAAAADKVLSSTEVIAYYNSIKGTYQIDADLVARVENIGVGTSQNELVSIMEALKKYESDATAEAEFKAAKNDLKRKVTNNQTKLTGEQHTDLSTRAARATTMAEVNSINAELDGIIALYDAKVAGKNEINRLQLTLGFNDGARDAYHARINHATSIASLNAVVAEVSAYQAFNEAKAAAEVKLIIMLSEGKITTTDYNVLKVELGKTTTVAGVDSVMATAESLAKISTLKNESIATLNELKEKKLITQGQFDDASKAIRYAKTEAEINRVMAGIDEKVSLAEAKKKAKEEVEGIKGLSRQRIEDYKGAIDASDTATKVMRWVTLAKEEGALNLAKEEANKSIAALVKSGAINVTEANAYNNRIAAAKTVTEVNSIVNEATTYGELKSAKKNANETVTRLVSAGTLSMNDGKHFESQISKAKTVKEVEDVLANATGLPKARKLAINELKGYYANGKGKLSEADFVSYEKRINVEAKSPAEVEAIMKEVRELIGEVTPTSETKTSETKTSGTKTSETKTTGTSTSSTTKPTSTTSSKGTTVTSTKKVTKVKDGKKLP